VHLGRQPEPLHGRAPRTYHIGSARGTVIMAKAELVITEACILIPRADPLASPRDDPSRQRVREYRVPRNHPDRARACGRQGLHPDVATGPTDLRQHLLVHGRQQEPQAIGRREQFRPGIDATPLGGEMKLRPSRSTPRVNVATVSASIGTACRFGDWTIDSGDYSRKGVIATSSEDPSCNEATWCEGRPGERVSPARAS